MHDNGAEILFYMLPLLSLTKKLLEFFSFGTGEEASLLAFEITRKHWNPMTGELRRLNK